MNAETQSEASIFISHRHDDKLVADVFRKAFEEWSNGYVRVFQSSHAETALKIGQHLDESVKDAIANATAILLVYTTHNANWSWCMYECGLAQDPTKMETTLVVFHCTLEPPDPLKHLVTVPFSEAALVTLAHDFHREQRFFPTRDDSAASGLGEDRISKRGQALYADLTVEMPDIRPREVRRCDRLTLTLDLDLVEDLKQADEDGSYEEAIAHAKEVIGENAEVHSVSGEPHAHFNYEDITGSVKFSDLVDRWKKESENTALEWQDELYEEMARAVLNRKEGPLSAAFDSVHPNTNAWFLPVLSRVRVVPTERRVEFDVMFCRLKPKAAKRMMQIG